MGSEMCIRDSNHYILHLHPGIHPYCPSSNLSAKRRIDTEHKLLACLTPRVKGSRDLGPAKGAVGNHPSILPCEGDSHRNALVYDRGANLSKAVHISLAGAKVTAFDGVIE